MKKKLTIITPTFNRVNTIKRLFESLKKQDNNEFVWLIVDDGSTDGTLHLIDSFKNDKVNIEYIYKENGGKHTALNVAFEKINTELACIVDSDDYLCQYAVKTIINDWEKYKDDTKICGLCYLKELTNGKIVSNTFPEHEKVDNYNEYIINKNILGDKFEIFKSNILKKHKFPIFENEKFLGEGVMWSIIAHTYDMVFYNKALYICEYLESGLTKKGRKIRINNPRGGMYHAKEYINKRYRFKVRIKNSLLYLTYSMFAKENVIKNIINSEYKLLFLFNLIPSLALKKYWSKKYID